MIYRCGFCSFLLQRRKEPKSAAWGWEGFNQTKAPKTKNFKIAWLSLDFNISPSPRPLPLCGHSPAKRVRHTIKGMSICHLRSIAVILWKAFALMGESYFSKASLSLCLHKRVRTKREMLSDRGTKTSSPSLSRERPREVVWIYPHSYT